MSNEDERALARRIYNEEARLRSFHENLDVLLRQFESVSRIDCDSLGATLVTEHWIKSVVTSGYIIYRRPKEENDFTELVLPCLKDEFYEARVLIAGSRYAEFHHTTIADVLERWTGEPRPKIRWNVTSPQKFQFPETT